MTIKYTDRELADAKDFLRRRIDSELSMHADVDELLTLYAGILLDALYACYTQDLMRELLSVLVDRLLYDCEVLSLDEGREDMRDEILAYMYDERNGNTLRDMVVERVYTFFNEVYAVHLAGNLLGLAKEALLTSIKQNLKHPYDSELLNEVREKISTGEIAGDIEDFDKPHFGQGVEVSSLGALQTITGHAVSDAWMWWRHEHALKDGANAYVVLRGSSYPCDECDSHTGELYRIEDGHNRPQYHPHCCCVVVYLNVDEEYLL